MALASCNNRTWKMVHFDIKSPRTFLVSRHDRQIINIVERSNTLIILSLNASVWQIEKFSEIDAPLVAMITITPRY